MMKDKRKAFTLVELLAVIAILAIILLIAVPTVLGILEEAKVKSFKLSVMGIFDAAELEYAMNGTTGGEVSKLPMNPNPFIEGNWSYNEETGEIIITGVTDGEYEVDHASSNDGEDFEVSKNGEPIVTEITINGKNPDRVSCSATENYQDQGAKYKENNLTTEDTVNLAKAGTYLLKYHYEKYHATRVVNVTNTNQPTLNINETEVTIIKGDQFDPSIYIESASDPCEGDITRKVQSVSEVLTDIGGTYTVTYKVKNLGNVETTKTLTVTVVDLTAPEPELPEIPEINGGWFDDEPTIGLPVNPNIDSYEYAISMDGGTTWGEYRPVTGNQITIDVEGNNIYIKIRGKRKDKYTDPVIKGPFKVDLTAPSCVSSGGNSNWVTSLTLTGTCSDTVSGCASPTVTKLFNSTTNITNGSPGTVRDNAGHETVCPTNQTVKVDVATPGAPTIAGASTTWTTGNRTFTATAPSSSSGIANYEYYVSNSNTIPGVGQAATGTGLTVSQNGKFVFFRAINNANTKGAWTAAQNLYVDKAALGAPTMAGASTTWTSGNRTFTATAPSSTSGIKNYEYFVSGATTAPAASQAATGTGLTVSQNGKFVFFRAINNAGTKGAWTAAQNLYVDTVAPTLTRKVASHSVVKGTSYAVTGFYTVSYGASGGTTTCKVGSTVVTNLNSLAAGSHTVTCTATSGAGKATGPISIAVSITNPAYLVDSVNVGDYVGYDAGTWTSTAGNPAQTHGSFGNYTAGQSKNYGGSNVANQGWRVLSKSGSGAGGVVTLVHAGVPEQVYLSSVSSSAVTLLDNRASQYLNTTYATSGRSVKCEDAQVYVPQACVKTDLYDYDFVPAVLRGGDYYWLASTNNSRTWRVTAEGNISNQTDFTIPNDFGYRPVIILKAGIFKTGGSGTSTSPYTISI